MSLLLPAWDGRHVPDLLQLDAVAPDVWRTRHGDANRNGRAYGGQTLGQALAAAAQGVPGDRPATMMQALFLQGVDPATAIDYRVATLQQGKRFTSRHVRATQRGGRTVLDAQVSFALPVAAPAHAAASGAPDEDPERLPGIEDLRPWWPGLQRLSGYGTDDKPSIDFRMPAPERQVAAAHAGTAVRFWMKARHAVVPRPDQPHLHAAVFAYLSDWWLNFASLGAHMREVPPGRRLYIASLNHALWLHQPFAADRWLHVQAESPAAHGGRGLSVARVHDRQGLLVASATQEVLMLPTDDAAGGAVA